MTSPLGFKARVGSALFECSGGVRDTLHITCSLRFTSGATPADFLAASMAAEPSLPHTCKALVGLETRSYHATTHSVRSGRPDALPTELSRLGSLTDIVDVVQYLLVNSLQYTF